MDTDEQREQSAGGGRRRWLGLGLVVTALIVVGARLILPAAAIEAVFARGLYPWINAVFVPLTGALPVSLSLVVLVALPVVLPGIWLWRRRHRRPGPPRSFGRRLTARVGRALGAALVLYAWFLLAWGFGYGRTPIEQRLGLTEVEITDPEVREFLDRFAERLRADTPTDSERDYERARAAFVTALADWIETHDGWRPALPPGPKSLPSGALLTFGVSGVISPFLLEAHVDGALPEVGRLGIGAHELAHVAGLCGEADADLVSYLAGLRAADRYARYAVELQILQDLRTLPRSWWKDLDIPPRALADLAAIRSVVRSYRSERLAGASWAIYDSYLQSQGVDAGVRDYSRGLGLLLRAWRSGLLRL